MPIKWRTWSKNADKKVGNWSCDQKGMGNLQLLSWVASFSQYIVHNNFPQLMEHTVEIFDQWAPKNKGESDVKIECFR